MAYNLQPLITILEGILDPDQTLWIVDENNPQIQSLLDKATSLQQLLDSKSSLTKLDSKIREVAHQAEDILEYHMVHMLPDPRFFAPTHVRFTLSTPDLQQVIRELGSVMEQAEKLMEMEERKMPRELDSSSSSGSKSAVVVGIDEDLMQLKDRLTRMEKKLEIVPIVGMGGVAFPEDYEIKGSKLVYMWNTEGFVKSNGERSLEEKAKDWLKSLVERNLFLVSEYNKNYYRLKPKSYYSMHDMLRIYASGNLLNGPSHFNVSNPRRVSFHNFYQLEHVNEPTDSMELTRSIICIGFQKAEYSSGAFFASVMVRVLDLMDMDCDRFPTEIYELVNLRFLGVGFRSSIPRGISRLCNLQTLIAPRSRFDEPAELWKLSELRNVKVRGAEWLKDEERNYSVMKKLQRISFNIWEEEATTWDDFHKSIPNIKKLFVSNFLRTSRAMDLSQLHKLESLSCSKIRSISSPDGFGRCFRVIFPCNIRKVILMECEMILGAWRTLCALQKLEVLTMLDCNFVSEEEKSDEEWELAYGDEFPSLHFLTLDLFSLVRWIANETNYPVLCHLRLSVCQKLEEIPSGIGEIPTLQLIELFKCSEFAVASAERIVEEQSENGNDLKLRIITEDES
ncbi:putative late blight resistance protein homolog R1B-16 isoform X3 [Salvia hispanica]|uniref:putative late blight resistance protein homolog R1B-16 isoform X3 n=1 Tax=Salvia hispanica TaxID=49212 RepID=UPI0020097BA9|nr:putative late blight resistance protein homolog R1B-16 isoform X3 [Salvia hispanica]